MKIISIGNANYTCPKCKSVLEINKFDWITLRSGLNSNNGCSYVKCPVCKTNIYKNDVVKEYNCNIDNEENSILENIITTKSKNKNFASDKGALIVTTAENTACEKPVGIDSAWDSDFEGWKDC